MGLEIFKLFGSIQVNNSKANESISDTDKKAQGVASTLLKGVGTAAKWGAGIAGAAVVGVSALTGIVLKATDAASAINDSSAKVGLTAENYQKYAYTAKLSGIETSKLDSLMVKSQKTFTDAKTGSETASEAYKQLGIDINSIGNSSDAFDATINALASMTDETQRNALANDIFGKSYADLSPLLNEGADGIAKIKQEAVDMGAVMSNDAVAAGDNFGDTIDKLKSAGMGLFNSLGTSLIPLLQQFADMIIANMPMIQGVVAQLAPVISGMFNNLLPPVMQLVQTLMPMFITLIQTLLPPITQIINEILPVITGLLNLLLPPIMQLVQALLPPLLQVVQALMPVFRTAIELLKPIIELFMKLLKPITDLISTAIAPLITKLADLINTILKPIIPVIQKVADIIGDVLGAAFDALSPVIDNIMGVFQGLIDFVVGIFTGDWKKAFQGVSDIIKNIFEGIINIVKAPINFIIDGINLFIKGLNKLKIPDWVPVIGGKGIDIPEIPKLAEGGTVYKKGKAIVGEAGAELLDLPAGARITPLTNAQKSLDEDKGKQINLNVNLNIKEFVNNTMADIQEIADEIAFQTKRKLEGGGLAYA